MNGQWFSRLRAIGWLAVALGLTSLAAAAHHAPGTAISGKPAAKQPTPVPRPSAPPPIAASLYFTAPVPGDRFHQGDSATIRWARVGNIGQNCFQLHLFRNHAHVLSIADQESHFHRQWTVPDTLSGTGYMFRVLTCDRRYYGDSPSFPIISSKPDLMVAQHSVTPINAAVPGGDMRVRFRARVDNIGAGPAGPSRARLQMIHSGPAALRVEVFDVPGLAFGGHHHLSKDLTLSLSGAWTYRFEVDWGDQVHEDGEGSPSGSGRVIATEQDVPAADSGQTEPDLGNNLATGCYSVAALPDLEMTSLFKDPEHAQYINRTVKITGHVTNVGTAPARNVRLEISCTQCNMGLASGSAFETHSQTLPSLGARDDHWFHFNLSWPCQGEQTCRVKADSANAVQEFREDNNEKSITVRTKIL
ncbi:MAG: hypothetical protein JW940_08015 [Polyangiaceae bacterium]|nr:hypothetical protein [Polyangiaceae bacterium]